MLVIYQQPTNQLLIKLIYVLHKIYFVMSEM